MFTMTKQDQDMTKWYKGHSQLQRNATDLRPII
jgi:hypothetical protein